MEDRKLLLIEDDPFLIEWIERLQKESFPETQMIVVRSEREFLIKRLQLAKSGIKGIILDVMLPWEDGVELDSAEFSDWRGEHFDAGLRIMVDLYETPRLATVPILIYSANDLSALDLSKARQPQTTYMRKDQPDQLLVQWVTRL